MFSEQTNIHYAHTIKPAQQGHLEDKKKKIYYVVPALSLLTSLLKREPTSEKFNNNWDADIWLVCTSLTPMGQMSILIGWF